MKQKLIASFLIIVMVASAVAAVGFATATTVAAATTTQTTLSVSKTNANVIERVTLTVTLKRWNAATRSYVPLAYKYVTVFHTFNGVTHTDVTLKTNANGKFALSQSFGSTGKRVYYAKFAGDSSYAKSTSNVVTVTVKYGTTLAFSGFSYECYYTPWGTPYDCGNLADGYLKDKTTGKPIVGAVVTLARQVGSTWTYVSAAKTNAKGYYEAYYTQDGYYRAHYFGNTLYSPSYSAVEWFHAEY